MDKGAAPPRFRRELWLRLLPVVAGLFGACATFPEPCVVLDPGGGIDGASRAMTTAHLLPEGYRILASAASPPSSPGDPSPVVLFALAPIDEGEMASGRPPSPRLLLVFMREGGTRYRLAGRSEGALAPYGWDEFFPDALSELSISATEIAITHYGGGRRRWGRTDRFRYDSRRDGWYWLGTELDYFDSLDLEFEGEHWEFGPGKLGEIPLSAFDIRSEKFRR